MSTFYSIFGHRINFRKDLEGLLSKGLIRISLKVAVMHKCYGKSNIKILQVVWSRSVSLLGYIVVIPMTC